MTRWTTTLFVLIGIIVAFSILGYYQQIARSPEIGNSTPIVGPAPVNNAGNAENHYKACLTAADKARDVTWEINCEQLNDGAAQTYNNCVTAHALANKAGTIERDCQTNCILPREVAKKLIQTRDDAKAACLKNKPAESAK